MSSGVICGEFWGDKAIPILVKRYMKVCGEEYK